MLGVTDVVSVANYFGDTENPAAQAVANLTAAGVLSARGDDLDAALTRGTAAAMLERSIDLLTRR